MPKKIQKKIVFTIKIFNVIIDLFSLVDFPIQDLDLSDYVINKKLPTHEINT